MTFKNLSFYKGTKELSNDEVRSFDPQKAPSRICFEHNGIELCLVTNDDGIVVMIEGGSTDYGELSATGNTIRVQVNVGNYESGDGL